MVQSLCPIYVLLLEVKQFKFQTMKVTSFYHISIGNDLGIVSKCLNFCIEWTNNYINLNSELL